MRRRRHSGARRLSSTMWPLRCRPDRWRCSIRPARCLRHRRRRWWRRCARRRRGRRRCCSSICRRCSTPKRPSSSARTCRRAGPRRLSMCSSSRIMTGWRPAMRGRRCAESPRWRRGSAIRRSGSIISRGLCFGRRMPLNGGRSMRRPRPGARAASLRLSSGRCRRCCATGSFTGVRERARWKRSTMCCFRWRLDARRALRRPFRRRW